MENPILLSIIIIVASLTQSPERIGWRGIVPLRSTRTQVERELGSLDPRCECYKTEKEIVHVHYATAPCTGHLPGWNVPRDTVLSMTVAPMTEPAFSDFEPNKSDFVKTTDHSFTSYYGDGNRGIRYSVSASGFVTSVSYQPSVKDNYLRCAGFPLTDGGVTAYNRYNEFFYGKLDDITSELGAFVIQLQKSPDYKGYVIIYAPYNKKIPGIEEFSNKAKDYMIDDLRTDPRAIEVIRGGYREEATVELFLIPRQWPAPIPTPTFAGILK